MDYWAQANGTATGEPQDYWGAATGAPQVSRETKPEQPKPESWGEWAINTVKGRQDPAYAGTPSVFSQFRGDLSNPTGMAALAGASDEQMGDVIRKQLGDRVLRTEKDSYGNQVIVTRGPDGQEQRGYVNVPGLDREDVARGIRGALPYAVTGGAAGAALRGAGVGINAIAQGVSAAGTSVAGDVAQIPLGSEQGIELGKAAAVGGFGAAGPVVGKVAGALWNRFVTIPGLVDKTTGQLTPKGIAAAQRAGLNPDDVQGDFAQRFAKALAETGDEAQAATRAGAEAFDIPVTRGQATKDPYLLTQEEAMRRRLYGQSAQDTMRGFDERQAAAVRQGALGAERDIGSPVADVPSVARTVAPNRNAGAYEFDRNPGPLGDDIGASVRGTREAARAEEGALWDDGVRGLEASPYALATLRGHVEDAVQKAGIADATPTLEKALKAVGEFADGKLPVQEAGGIKLKATQSVDDMRRRLGSLMDGLEGSEKRAVGVVYDAFNDWIGESAKNLLLIGDPEKAMQLVQARAFTKAVREMFGNKSAGSRLSNILDGKADSGERVIESLFGAQGGKGVSQGAITTLKTIKAALDRFTPEGAEAAWSDIKLAYWTRLVTGKNGEMLGATAITNNIKNALHRQSSIVQTLYSREEIREIRKYLGAVEAAAFKPPNASGSGYTAASLIKDGLLRVLDAFGLGTTARAAVGASGIEKAFGAAQAQRAVSGAVTPKRPNLGPGSAPIGQQYDRQSR